MDPETDTLTGTPVFKRTRKVDKGPNLIRRGPTQRNGRLARSTRSAAGYAVPHNSTAAISQSALRILHGRHALAERWPFV